MPSILSLAAVTIGPVLFEQQRRTVEHEGSSYRFDREQLREEMDKEVGTPPAVTGLLDQIDADDWGTIHCGDRRVRSTASRSPGGVG